MQSKSLLIAIAAFAVTTTGVYAYNDVDALVKAGLDETQIEAIAEARELRRSGDLDGARDRLVEAGIDEHSLRAMSQARHHHHSAIREALEYNDYEAFKTAIADSPLADIITSEDDFRQFREAHELRQAGEQEGADELMRELGVTGTGSDKLHGRSHMPPAFLSDELTDEQRAALQVAHQANDRETIQAILEEAGIDHMPAHHHGW